MRNNFNDKTSIFVIFSIVLLIFSISPVLSLPWNSGYCGDLICNNGETQFSCPTDCGTPATECTPGETQSQSCGYTGSQTRTCLSNGYWSNWGNCVGGCNPNVWNSWSVCSESCDGGIQTRTNECGTTETQQCNTQACPPVCNPNAWSSWSVCSASCDGGIQTRTNDCGTTETQQCNTQACPLPNNPPVSNDAGFSTRQNNPVVTTMSATDADGDSLTYSIVSTPSNGVLSGSGNSRTYAPNLGWYGIDSYTFMAYDGTDYSNTATITINVEKRREDKKKKECVDNFYETGDLCKDKFYENMYFSQFNPKTVLIELDDLNENSKKEFAQKEIIKWLLTLLLLLIILLLILLAVKKSLS